VSAPSKKTGEDRIEELLEDRKGDIMALFAKDESPEASFKRAKSLSVNAYRKMMQDAEERAASKNPPERARPIDETSTVACCLWAMQRKLDIGADVYPVPYGVKVQPVLGPQGVIKLAFRSGFVKSVDARAVFKGEVFDYELGSERFVKHKKNNKRPTDPRQAWDLLEHAYCVVELKDSTRLLIEVLDKADIIYYRSLSPTGNYASSGWGKFPWEFARKSALKQGLKNVPLESEISEILTADETERGIDIGREFWDALGTKMPGLQIPQDRGSDKGAAPPATKQPAAGPKQTAQPPHDRPSDPAPRDPFAGDPDKVFMPGKKGEAPPVSQADPADLAKWEGRLRGDLDSGKWDTEDFAKYKQGNLRQLATIRARMRAIEMVVTPHEMLDGVPVPTRREPDPLQGELTPDQEAEMLAASGGGDTAGYAD
jgi:phage RecT family recombinase